MGTLVTVLVAVGCIGAFVAMWIVVIAILSAASGWRRLAAKFARVRDERRHVTLELYKMQTLFMGLTRYKNCITVRVFEDGLQIQPMFAFTFAHPPLFIPTRAIANVEPLHGIRPTTAFSVGGATLRLVGASARSSFWDQYTV